MTEFKEVILAITAPLIVLAFVMLLGVIPRALKDDPRFRLRTMFVAIAAVAVLCGWAAYIWR